MPKILKIEESKIVTKNGIQVQRVIFSDDKIVYVRIDDGEVYPKTTADKYVDLINAYNASHDNIDSTKPKTKPSEFWGETKNYIKDGSEDRYKQIQQTKNKKKLSKDRDTQRAINRMRDFGIVLMVGGLLETIGIIITTAIFLGINNGVGDGSWIWLVAIDLALGIALITSGRGIAKLETEPSGIKSTAVVAIIIGVIFLLLGGLKLGGLIIIIYAIVALVKVGRYEEWFYGEIE